jgi:phthiodiolone/phenolphthiodiolone dimycocerosates ketoreductase
MTVPFTSGLNVGTGPPLGRVNGALRAARVLGFDTAWTVDHFLGFFPEQIWDKDFTWLAGPGSSPHEYFEYQTLLGYLATRAGTVRLGVGVTEPTRRHPVLLAQALLSLAHMTKRAPILGIGSGERENIEPYGLGFDRPVGRLEEALAIIRRCFISSGPFDFSGEHFQLAGARMDLPAPPGRTPQLWVAAHGPRMLELTGRFGDGWYPGFPFSPQRYGEMLGTIRDAARTAGRDADRIVAGWQAVVVVAPGRKEARRMLEAKAVRFSTLLASDDVWQSFGQEHPLGAGFRGMIDFMPDRYTKVQLEDAMARVPVDLLAEALVWGTPDDLFVRFSEYRDAGLRHLVIQPVSAMVSRRAALYSLRAVVSIQRRLRQG